MEGDSNTKFFRAFATTRKKKSAITKLTNESGEVVTDQEGMCNIVKLYFENLFGQREVVKENELNLFEAVIA